MTSHSSNFAYIRDAKHAWVPAEVVEVKDQKATVRIPHYESEQVMQSGGGDLKKSKNVTVDLEDYPYSTLPLQNVNEKGKLQVVEDMVKLPYLHEAAILYNLKARSAHGSPYTRAGDIIIAVNPYQWLDLYTERLRLRYSRVLVWEHDKENLRRMPPHVYEVSATAYRSLALEQQNQSILVSGESGAGKTETVKICMNHIASVQLGNIDADEMNLTANANIMGRRTSTAMAAKRRRRSSAVMIAKTERRSSAAMSSPIVQRVLESNAILEAFGNAKTLRNDNSSRFGKYIQLQFDGEDPHEATLKGKHMPNCVLAGSQSDVYLLEKSRVVGHSEGERTYHIFYQLLAAPKETKMEFWSGLKGTTNESFQYVGFTDTTSIDGIADEESFGETIDSLALIGVLDDKLQMLMRAICVVLQLGNIMFAPDPKDSEHTVLQSTAEFTQLCELLGLETDILVKAFTVRTVKAGGDSYKVPINSEKAKDSVDALAKEVYAKTFLWLVREINAATCAEYNYKGKKRSDYGIIGLLDIFGFESFKENGFEQICINYANEKLQKKFCQDVFSTVQKEYESEGIEVGEITYDDNTDVLMLIEGKVGLIKVLNEECFRPNGNEAAFVQKSLQLNKNSPCLIVQRIDSKMSFGVRHYAGTVVYRANNFVTKNTDTIPNDVKDAVADSSNDIIAKHLNNDGTMKGELGRAKSNSVVAKKKSGIVGETVWTKFKNQLGSLNDNLTKTHTHYIRCIKPNKAKKPGMMEHQSTVEQLRCAGAVAAVTISRSAFPNRLEHDVVLDRFSTLWPRDQTPIGGAEGVDCLLSQMLMERQTISADGKVVKAFVIGKTRTYFRAGALEQLETIRMNGMAFKATKIQSVVRGNLAKERFQNARLGAVVVQSCIRMRLARRRLLHKKHEAELARLEEERKAKEEEIERMRQEKLKLRNEEMERKEKEQKEKEEERLRQEREEEENQVGQQVVKEQASEDLSDEEIERLAHELEEIVKRKTDLEESGEFYPPNDESTTSFGAKTTQSAPANLLNDNPAKQKKKVKKSGFLGFGRKKNRAYPSSFSHDPAS